MTYKDIIFKLAETPDEELKNMTEEERLVLMYHTAEDRNDIQKTFAYEFIEQLPLDIFRYTITKEKERLLAEEKDDLRRTY